MKRILFVFTVLSFVVSSCGDSKKEEVKKEIEAPKEEVKETPAATAGSEDLVAMGEKLFTEKTCVSCHQAETKIVGPAIKNIVQVYSDQGASIVGFLEGKQEAIVDTDPGQVAIMKANLDGFVKDLKEDELKALEAYMMSIK